MTDNTNTPAAAPASAPTPQAAPSNQTIQRPAPSTPAEQQAREARVAQRFEPAVGAAPTEKHVARSPLITNATPMRDPDAPVEDNTPSELPEATLAEMEAGRRALNRNRPVPANRARTAAPDDRLQGGRITTETNPVDATQRMQQNKEI